MINFSLKYRDLKLKHIVRYLRKDVWDGSVIKLSYFSLVLFVVVLFIPKLSTAEDKYVIAQPSERQAIRAYVLDRDEIELAEEFHDIISQLEKIANDYQEYFEVIDNKYARKYQRVLIKILLKIDQGKYNGKIDYLYDDLTNFEKELALRERELKNNPEQKKFYRNVRSLRSQLDLLAEYIQEDLNERLKENEETLAEIKIYLHQKQEKDKSYEVYLKNIYQLKAGLLVRLQLENDELEDLYSDDEGVMFLNLDNLEDIIDAFEDIDFEEFQKTFENLEHLKSIEKLEALDSLFFLPAVRIKPVRVPLPPLPPRDLKYRKYRTPEDVPAPESYEPVVKGLSSGIKKGDEGDIIISTFPSGEVSIAKSFINTVVVPTREIPIYIDNQVGDLVISGWKKNKIDITFEVEILAGDKKNAQEFVSKIELKTFTHRNKIYISSSFPKLNDPKRKIHISQMTVNVPMYNQLICESAFGLIEIENIKKNIRINAKHCEISISDIEGGIEVINTSGEMNISNSSGNINVTNSYGPINIWESNGKFDIKNSYADIDISDSRGPVRILSSGEIEIYNHIGKFDIDNQNGTIKVTLLNGNINVKNSFRPLYLSKITGDVIAINNRANIIVDNIDGVFKASNRSGRISGENMFGPIQVDNIGGEIAFVLSEYNFGPSVINSEYGVINLEFDKNSNLTISANTEGGDIISSFNQRIVKTDEGFSSKFIIGDGENIFKITGINTVIKLGKSN